MSIVIGTQQWVNLNQPINANDILLSKVIANNTQVYPDTHAQDTSYAWLRGTYYSAAMDGTGMASEKPYDAISKEEARYYIRQKAESYGLSDSWLQQALADVDNASQMFYADNIGSLSRLQVRIVVDVLITGPYADADPFSPWPLDPDIGYEIYSTTRAHAKIRFSLLGPWKPPRRFLTDQQFNPSSLALLGLTGEADFSGGTAEFNFNVGNNTLTIELTKYGIYPYFSNYSVYNAYFMSYPTRPGSSDRSNTSPIDYGWNVLTPSTPLYLISGSDMSSGKWNHRILYDTLVYTNGPAAYGVHEDPPDWVVNFTTPPAGWVSQRILNHFSI